MRTQAVDFLPLAFSGSFGWVKNSDNCDNKILVSDKLSEIELEDTWMSDGIRISSHKVEWSPSVPSCEVK